MRESERGCSIELKEAGWTNRRTFRHQARSVAVIGRCVNNVRYQRQRERMAAVDRRPQQSDSQSSCHSN
ncbi:hypothetical protein TNCV_2088051 [Trichonephila clavipes]|nr:hypothetical protein TNCV_2088051 [Trichonephila clavipes]